MLQMPQKSVEKVISYFKPFLQNVWPMAHDTDLIGQTWGTLNSWICKAWI